MTSGFWLDMEDMVKQNKNVISKKKKKKKKKLFPCAVDRTVGPIAFIH